MTESPCRVVSAAKESIAQLLHQQPLDSRRKQPLYVQLSQLLRTLIEESTLRPGTRLPPEKELQRLFQVSRITIRQALEILVHEGLIRRRRGLGTKVLAPRQEVVLDRRVGLEQALRARGAQVYRHPVESSSWPADPEVASFLRVATGNLVLRQVSVLFADGDRVACTEQYRTRTVPGPHDGGRENGGARPEPRQQTVEMVPASHPAADHLRVPEGAPLLRHVLGFLLEGRPVERQVHHYRADCYRFHFRI